MITFIVAVVCLIIGAFVGYGFGNNNGYSLGRADAKRIFEPTPAKPVAKVTAKPVLAVAGGKRGKKKTTRKGGKSSKR